ncbi:hypothetical protein G647_09603 [Cladophialophora carrionii CBS 160.54]|uniref:Uncharacterized protein n=1 Tax=Cladophialophora carrionii CBS 160.54 TaxID=1279043 RepID=V9DM66_9EURO|nr:uncharacterized protein G647_09603 [Cladophialophora carrionii CBS 160.54]ETI27413.1 hypothetical protein G647_09603 [Cladophialophora carrionii CBS 160.54]
MNCGTRFPALIEELVGAATSADRTEPHTKQAFNQLLDDISTTQTLDKAKIVMLNRGNIAAGSKRFMERVTEIRRRNTLSLLKEELQLALTKVSECEAAIETACGAPNDRRKRRAQQVVDEQLGQVEAVRKRLKADAAKVEDEDEDEDDSDLDERQESQELGPIAL